MDYMPVESPLDTDEAMFDAPPGASWTHFPKRYIPAGETIRYRGLALDLATGVVLLQEREVRLATAERDLLKALMRRAGQIISAALLAEQLGVTIAEIEGRAHALAEALSKAGSCCLPRRVEGLGYVLWR